MFDYTNQERSHIDQQLEPILSYSQKQAMEAQQLAFDATRILSCTEDRLKEYCNQGFFKRCWFKLSGKTDSLDRANQHDLITMQKTSWRYLQLLQERDLMLANSIITVKNNLLTLAVKEEETRKYITEMANIIYTRFISFEERIGKLEVAANIHSWLLTLDTCDYDVRYPEYIRLLKIVRDFHSLKASDWNLQEIKYLQKAVGEVGLESKKRVSLNTFVSALIDEIDRVSYDLYRSIVCLPQNGGPEVIPSAFIFDNVAIPSYTSLFKMVDNYPGASETLQILSDQLKISQKDALKHVLMTYVKKAGIDLNVEIPLRDLAVELLTCMGMTAHLYRSTKDLKPPATSPEIRVSCSQAGNVQGASLSENDYTSLVSAYSECMSLHITQIALDSLSNYIDEYLEAEDWDVEQLVRHFTARKVANRLNKQIDIVCAEIHHSAHMSRLENQLEDAIRAALDSSKETFIEKIREVEQRGAELLDADPSMAASLVKGAAIGIASAATFGLGALIAGLGANYLHEKSKGKRLQEKADAFDNAIHEMLQSYDTMLTDLQSELKDSIQHVITTDITAYCLSGNKTKLDNLVTSMDNFIKSPPEYDE
jgi:hypothetical protein